jgi:hypothetical protein
LRDFQSLIINVQERSPKRTYSMHACMSTDHRHRACTCLIVTVQKLFNYVKNFAGNSRWELNSGGYRPRNVSSLAGTREACPCIQPRRLSRHALNCLSRTVPTVHASE